VIAYFGQDYQGKGPSDLLQKAAQRGELSGKWPKILVMYCELDPQGIIDSNVEFISELGKHRKDLTYWMLQGHNHFSPPLALGTEIEVEEKWGNKVGEWILS